MRSMTSSRDFRYLMPEVVFVRVIFRRATDHDIQAGQHSL